MVLDHSGRKQSAELRRGHATPLVDIPTIGVSDASRAFLLSLALDLGEMEKSAVVSLGYTRSSSQVTVLYVSQLEHVEQSQAPPSIANKPKSYSRSLLDTNPSSRHAPLHAMGTVVKVSCRFIPTA